MKTALAVISNKAFLLAIQLAWLAILFDSFYGSHNEVLGHIVIGATWIISLFVPGNLADYMPAYALIIVIFPAIFIFTPAIILLKISRLRGARHANP